MTDLDSLKALAGITSAQSVNESDQFSAAKKAEFMKKHNIRPGTDEWFKLWFAKPKLTGEDPFGGKNVN